MKKGKVKITYVLCDYCHGTGKLGLDFKKCIWCNGNGSVVFEGGVKQYK